MKLRSKSGINLNIIFPYDTIKLFNITRNIMTEDIDNTGNMIPMLVPNPLGGFLDINAHIMIDQNHNINFQNVCDSYKLFLPQDYVLQSITMSVK
ncbi:MAG: hypothetical protein Ta2E_10390 [Mycoplasmoidaceae bacterium]|nr:MAG: hypothetical protein Ta2E_10390 [Mycoplasmoidaceae bacterium]